MSFSGGVFSINTSGQPVVSGTTISAIVFNALTADIATGLSTCMLKNGTQTATAGIGFYAGTVSLPGIYFGTDTATGLYRIGLNNTGYSINGTKLLDLSATTFAVTGIVNSSGQITASTAQTNKAYIGGDANYAYLSNTATVNSEYILLDSANHQVLIGTNNSARVTVDTSGNLGLGYSSAIYWNSTANQYVVADATTVYTGVGGSAKVGVSTGSTGVRFYDYGAGALTTNGSGVISATSDLTKKTITGQFTRGREALRGWNPILYEWTAESGLHDGLTYAGYGAQHVLPHIPEAVFGIEGEYTVMDRPILMVTVNAINELDAALTSLREDFEAYKAAHP